MVTPNWEIHQENIMKLTKEASDAVVEANNNGLTQDTEQEIIAIVLEQEIVTYCSSKHSLQIDINDVVFEDD